MSYDPEYFYKVGEVPTSELDGHSTSVEDEAYFGDDAYAEYLFNNGQ